MHTASQREKEKEEKKKKKEGKKKTYILGHDYQSVSYHAVLAKFLQKFELTDIDALGFGRLPHAGCS